jgi:hypothetical protein
VKMQVTTKHTQDTQNEEEHWITDNEDLRH